jgi:hypothetical protein
MDRIIEFLKTDLGTLEGDRGLWDQDLQDVVRFIRPGTSDFLRELVRGESRHYEIYDGTALWALEQFAAGLHTYNTSPTDRWFTLSIDDEELLKEESIRGWLEGVSDIVYREFAKPTVGFNQAMHEAYLDLGALGTAIVYSEYDQKQNNIIFRALPLAQCYIRENYLGHVDTIYRKFEMTARQVIQQFPEAQKMEKMKLRRPHDKLKIVHAVFPSKDKFGKKHKTNKNFVSYWFCTELDDGVTSNGGLLDQGGFDDFPYHVPRWTKLAGEVYGRSPGRTALHDVRMVNKMAMTMIQKAEQVVNPSVEIEDDSVIGDVATGAGSIIWKEPGSAPITPVNSGARLDIGIDILDRYRDQIMKAFHVDKLMRQRKNERQTAYEISDDRNEMLAMMSPMLARLQVELYGPILDRTFELMARNGRIPEPPEELQGLDLEVKYTSPAAKAQQGAKALTTQRYIESLGLLAQMSPEVLDAIDVDVIAQSQAVWMDVPVDVTRTPDEINKIRQDKAEMEARQQGVDNAPLEARAVKDMAQARQISANTPV